MEAEAKRFLTGAFTEIRSQHAMPRQIVRGRWSRHDGPWPPYYACWEIARSELAAPLIQTLRDVYPDRFGEPSKFYYKDPEQYVTALLRAAIAINVVERGRPGVASAATRSVLYELDRVARAPGQTFAALWVVKDVNFDAVADQMIGPARLMTRGPGQPEEVVSQLLPEALWVTEHGYPMPGEKHQGLIYAQGVGAGFHWEVTQALNDDIGRALSALRIATAATARAEMVWSGEPSVISHPRAVGESSARRDHGVALAAGSGSRTGTPKWPQGNRVHPETTREGGCKDRSFSCRLSVALLTIVSTVVMAGDRSRSRHSP